MRGPCNFIYCALAALLVHSSIAQHRSGGMVLSNILFMADIGHDREHPHRLTDPALVMGKSAFEGAFSLYDGLADFVINQGARPDAILIAGDVAYGGGDAYVLNDTQQAFQRYLGGHIARDRVFPLIGNHDVNFLGCMMSANLNPLRGKCHYGAHQSALFSEPDLTFGEWRANWLKFFPGLSASISPGKVSGDKAWLAPLRYNLNLQPESSVYFILGLISGALVTRWESDTPSGAIDALAEGGDIVECAFLRDSLADGRSLGKTIFVYVTHDFKRACSDWSLMQQVDVWIYGHKHYAWQSADLGGIVVQEQRHYPVRLLIGNGGFDNGLIDVVSFGNLREEVLPNMSSEGGDRIRLHFDIYDACVSAGRACPMTDFLPAPSCWKKCRDFPGGHDSGGGPRKAMPSRHNLGFTFEAPRRAPAAHGHMAPFDGSWRLCVRTDNGVQWLALGRCSKVALSHRNCLVLASGEDGAATFAFYDASQEPVTQANKNVSARLAVVAATTWDRHAGGGGPVMAGYDRLYEGRGFYSTSLYGVGSMNPKDGWLFRFTENAGQWRVEDVSLRISLFGTYVVASKGERLGVFFRAPGSVLSPMAFV